MTVLWSRLVQDGFLCESIFFQGFFLMTFFPATMFFSCLLVKNIYIFIQISVKLFRQNIRR